jgi:hypothetical protein
MGEAHEAKRLAQTHLFMLKRKKKLQSPHYEAIAVFLCYFIRYKHGRFHVKIYILSYYLLPTTLLFIVAMQNKFDSAINCVAFGV